MSTSILVPYSHGCHVIVSYTSRDMAILPMYFKHTSKEHPGRPRTYTAVLQQTEGVASVVNDPKTTLWFIYLIRSIVGYVLWPHLCVSCGPEGRDGTFKRGHRKYVQARGSTLHVARVLE